MDARRSGVEAHPGVRRPQGGHTGRRRGPADQADDDAAADEPYGRLRRQRGIREAQSPGSPSTAAGVHRQAGEAAARRPAGHRLAVRAERRHPGLHRREAVGTAARRVPAHEDLRPARDEGHGLLRGRVEGRSRHEHVHLRSRQAPRQGVSVGSGVEAGVSVRQRRAALHHRRLLQVRADGPERRRGQRHAVSQSVNRGADAHERARRRSRGRHLRSRPAGPRIRARLRDRHGPGRGQHPGGARFLFLGRRVRHLVLARSGERRCRGGDDPERRRQLSDRRIATGAAVVPEAGVSGAGGSPASDLPSHVSRHDGGSGSAGAGAFAVRHRGWPRRLHRVALPADGTRARS